ncbi:MAG: NADH-quinone oxidoreductase subunit NuoH [Nitrospiraceae bacterium]|nr:NADH-quinone oxidoreductase subunit NuoH [Nitrospiraceae bacterium]
MNFFEVVFQPGIMDIIVKMLIILIKVVVVFGVLMLHVTYATYFERKSIGHMQVRLGPMRVGPHGLLQPIADFIKLFFKEDIIPAGADKPIFFIAPVISIFAGITAISVIPFFNGFVIADINIGLLFILAMSSLNAYGVVLAGWASNSKYSFLGALRSSAQVISYEIAMGLSLVGVMMMAGSLDLSEIVRAQQRFPGGFFWPQALGFFIFVVAAFAETNRTPFDLPEAESELVAGYFTEYSGMRFALFYVAEYVGMILMSLVAITCFLGGWDGPFAIPYVPFAWLLIKLYLFMFFFYWIRATVPRYRYDQLMALGWKLLIPLSLLNIVGTGLVKVLLR